MRGIFISLFTVLWLTGFCQQPQAVIRIDTSSESKKYWNEWAKELFEMGVEQKNDSFFVKGEVLLTFKDSVLRKSLYPEKYEWPIVVGLMQRMELKKAFWHMINIYIGDTTSRSKVMGIFILYDSIMEMDKILLNAFYTYGLADPRVCRMKNEKPEIYRPDLLEKHLNATKSIINYIWYYRSQKNKSSK
jgi:hypothetical protein